MFFVFVSKCLLFRYGKTAIFLTTEKIKCHWRSPWVSLLAKCKEKQGLKMRKDLIIGTSLTKHMEIWLGLKDNLSHQ